jgi:transcriptional regulator with XRE-family HTH domain
MSSKDILAANMRRLRLRAGWSQQQVGEKIGGWPRQAVSAAEGGKRAFALDDVDRIAAAFGRTVTEILTPMGPCPVCSDDPPAGMTCRACGTEGVTAPEEGAARRL